MITRKIPFTLIFALLLSPIHAAADDHFGAVVKKSPEIVLAEMAGKAAAKLLLGKAADSIFGSEQEDFNTLRKGIATSISDMGTKISADIATQTSQLTIVAQNQTSTTHHDKISSLSNKLSSYIRTYTNSVNWDKPGSVTLHLTKLDDILVNSVNYNLNLDDDIQVGVPMHDQWNGFWRSFVPYVSNKTTFGAFNLYQWQAKVRTKEWAPHDDEHQLLNVATTNATNLEDIYNHLEKHVPTLPVYRYKSQHQDGTPNLQSVNCALRTDPDTQLFTRKGEFISRYRGVHDIADRLPAPTRYWMMYAYCRSNLFSTPDVYYGWQNVNDDAYGSRVGPLAAAADCQQVVTFGRCQNRHDESNGCGYARTKTGHGGSTRPNNQITPGHGRKNMLYTKHLWPQGPYGISGVAAESDGVYQVVNLQGGSALKSYKTFTHLTKKARDEFNDKLKRFENSVCFIDPSGKKIADRISTAPVLPALTKALFGNTDTYPFMPNNEAPENIQNSLPLTVMKVPHVAIAGLADTNSYYFIKRDSLKYIPVLSKPYQSPMSAAHDRSLHYFTEFADYGLRTAYCQIASMISTGHFILNTLEQSLLTKPACNRTKANQENYQCVTQDKILKATIRYSDVSHKLGISKENVAKVCGKGAGENIVASIHDPLTIQLDQKDHALRNCLKVAAIDRQLTVCKPNMQIKYKQVQVCTREKCTETKVPIGYDTDYNCPKNYDSIYRTARAVCETTDESKKRAAWEARCGETVDFKIKKTNGCYNKTGKRG